MTTSPSPSSIDLLFPELGHELSRTRTMLQRFPDGHADWRPHPKSRSAGELATHLAVIPRHGWRLIEHDELDVTTLPKQPMLTAAADLLATFDRSVSDLRGALPRATPELLDKTWTMRAGPTVMISATRRRLLRDMLISHLIHHRAQLGVYYRLLDVAVPSTYGPSADEAARP